jgi:hypothetical protein
MKVTNDNKMLIHIGNNCTIDYNRSVNDNLETVYITCPSVKITLRFQYYDVKILNQGNVRTLGKSTIITEPTDGTKITIKYLTDGTVTSVKVTNPKCKSSYHAKLCYGNSTHKRYIHNMCYGKYWVLSDRKLLSDIIKTNVTVTL